MRHCVAALLAQLTLPRFIPTPPASKLPLDTLPSELQAEIFIRLDNPVPLSQVNKHFHALSKDDLTRARWFMLHHKPYEVIYEAIAHNRIFTAELLNCLVELKAPLTRNLVQLAHVLRHAAEPPVVIHMADVRWGGGKEREAKVVRWGRSISAEAYGALMQHAFGLVSAVGRGSRLTHLIGDLQQLTPVPPPLSTASTCP